MTKLWGKISKAVRHNQFVFIGLVLAVALSIWGVGCQSRVASLKTPSMKVTRLELNFEIESEQRRLSQELDNLIAQATVKNQQLDEQDAFKQSILEFGLLAAQGGTVNPLALIPMAAMLLGGGAVMDNRRKDAIIKGAKIGAAPAP